MATFILTFPPAVLIVKPALLSNPMVTVKPVVVVDVGGDREIFAQFEGGNTSLVLYTFGIESSSDYASFTQSNIDNNAQVAVFGHYYTDS